MSFVAACRLSLVAMLRLLVAVASLAAGVGSFLLWGTWASFVVACGLSSCGSQALERSSVAEVHRLNFFVAY